MSSGRGPQGPQSGHEPAIMSITCRNNPPRPVLVTGHTPWPAARR